MQFNEDFLHYIWLFRLFNNNGIKLASGEKMDVISTGVHNKNAGPDFEHAKIRIEETLWAGNVEIHLRSSDWDRHQHSTDQSYDNVILHVVFEHDKSIYRANGSEIPTLVLNERIPPEIALRYHGLMENLNWIPCEKLVAGVESFYIKNWLSRVLIERLEEKSKSIYQVLEHYKGSWDDAFYVILARNFGFKTNALPFELLARSLPQQILAKHKNDPLKIEALVFGQAGFLKVQTVDSYPKRLNEEYIFLQRKYRLRPMEPFVWKFLRMRPQNFPTLRLAQFAALVLKSSHLFSKVLEIKDVKSIKALFTELPVHAYWQAHFRFDKETGKVSTQLGDESINNILLNTVAVFLFSYGKYMGKGHFINRAVALLELLPAETNQVIKQFTHIGIKSQRADESQALLQLKKKYCDAKKCLTCGIGVKLINTLP